MMNRHLKCVPSIFGRDNPCVDIPQELLNGAGSIILARWDGYLQPFAVRLPHQVYVKDIPRLLNGAPELWALPVGVAGKWFQIAGPAPGARHPSS